MRPPATKSGKISTKSWSRHLIQDFPSKINWCSFARDLRQSVPRCKKTSQDCKVKFETMQYNFQLDFPNAFDTYPEEESFDALDQPFVPFDMQEDNVLDVQENAFRIQDADCKTWDAWDVSNSTCMESELSKSELTPEPIPTPAPDSIFYTWIHSDDDKSNHVQLQWETVPGLETVPLMTVDQFQHTFILASGV